MAESEPSVARSAGIVGLAVMCSRVLGLVRELVFAALFGAGRSMDAFMTAFRAPNLLRDMDALGITSAVVLPFVVIVMAMVVRRIRRSHGEH